MKVLLTQDVENLGMAGEVADVADGYGRNFLIPNGLAVLATPGALQNADLHRRRATEKRQRIADEMAALAASVGDVTLNFQAKAGEKGRLYGSITTADIADKLADAIGRDIDRRKLSLETPIKELGTHAVTLRLSSDITADFSVVVESDEQAAGAPTEDLESADAGGPVEALESIETPEPAAEEE
jgi:large subunit ribosomal protein L9